MNSLSLYRYWGDSRIYQDTVVASRKRNRLCRGKATIVYNADDQNVHKLYTQAPEKFDEDYAEKLHRVIMDASGRNESTVCSCLHVRKKDNATTTNHVVELEVYGTKPKKAKPGIDITALIDRLAGLSAVDTSNATTDSAAAFKALVKRGYDLVRQGADTEGNSYD